MRRRRGSIVPEDNLLDTFPSIRENASNFRFSAKTYLLTWSQIGDLSNLKLQAKMLEFGNNLRCKYNSILTFSLLNMNRLVWC